MLKHKRQKQMLLDMVEELRAEKKKLAAQNRTLKEDNHSLLMEVNRLEKENGALQVMAKRYSPSILVTDVKEGE